MKTLTSIILVYLFCISSSLSAQEKDLSRIDSLIKRVEEHDQAMGSLVLSKNGKIIYQKAFGYAQVDELKASTATRYRIGSISKIMTATIVLQLIEEKKLSLNTLLKEYYPDLPNSDKINIEHLLRHQSGLHNFTSDEEYLEYMETTQTHEAMLERFKNKEVDFEPGEKYSYSNTNYVLLSYIIENIEGQSFAKVFKKRIAKPLKLKATYYGGKTDPKKEEAYSYKYFGEWELSTETDMSIPTGAGAIVSTPKELTIFIEALFQGKLLKAASLEKMKTIEKGYGLGIYTLPFKDKKAYAHSGGIDEFVNMLSYFPEEQLAIAYCTNGGVMPTNDFLLGVLSTYFGEDYELPSFKKIKIAPEILDQYAGVYTNEQFPLDLTITHKGNILQGQATGQPSFILTALSQTEFEFRPAGLKLEFSPEGKKLTMYQGGAVVEFEKE